MTFEVADLGVLNKLATALGVFDSEGEPNPDWFGNPEASLKTILENNAQRNALIGFVDEVMGGADRTTDPTGVIWLPIVKLEDPQPDITFAVTIDDTSADGIHIGVGISVRTTNPTSNSTLSIPLFLAKKEGGPNVSSVFLLGSRGGRIRIGTSVTIDEGTPVPGEPRLGAIGLDIDVPTSDDDEAPVFGLSLSGFQLPGATTPRDIRVAADGLNELDDAVLDLVFSLVRAQAETLAPELPVAAIAGLLGLREGDAIPDFPIDQLPAQGLHAISTWMYNLITTTSSRQVWIDYLATLLDGNRVGDSVSFDLGDVELTLGLRVDTGASGNARLTPTLGVHLGNTDARVEARADLFQIDLVTGSALALPQFGVWAASGESGDPVLNIASPTARADTLRVGFALNEQRNLTFVLAADGVQLGTRQYATLDLTSPDAVMDAAEHSLEDIAEDLLDQLGDSLNTVRLLIGLSAPAGVTPISLTDLMTDPVAAVSGYWQRLISAPAGAMTEVLKLLRNALADQSAAAAATSNIDGTGTALDPWIIPLIKPLQLEVVALGTTGLSVSAALATSVDTLGQRCTVIQTHLAATLAEIQFSPRSANLLPRVEAVLSARERGVNPPRVMLALGNGVAVTASGVGLRLGWTPDTGLAANVDAPNLTLTIGSVSLPIRLPEIDADGNVVLSAEEWDAVEALVGYLGELIGGFLGDIVNALGWTIETSVAGVSRSAEVRLRLADLVSNPESALREWLPRVLMSNVGPRVLTLLADLFAGSGLNSRIHSRHGPSRRSLSFQHCRRSTKPRGLVSARGTGAAAGGSARSHPTLATWRPRVISASIGCLPHSRSQCRGGCACTDRGSRFGRWTRCDRCALGRR